MTATRGTPAPLAEWDREYGPPAGNGANGRPAYPPFTPLLDAPDDPPSWLATDFLLENEYTLLAGEGASYKTTVMLSIAAAVAGGYDVLGGFATGGSRRVLLVSGEDSAGVLKNRLQSLIAGHGWDPETIRPNLHHLALSDVLLTSHGWQRYLREQCAEYEASLLCMDPLADLIDADENDNSSARPVVQFFRNLSADGTATLLCHHYGKATEHRQGTARIRGASAWMNAARAIYTLETKDGGLWLGCGKLSRAERPKGRELRVEIQSDEANRAVWRQARVELAHPPGDWRVTDQRDLTPGERTALVALSRHAGESLSWSRWREVSGLSSSTLSEVIPRLRTLGLVDGNEAGKYRGRPVVAYSVTARGQDQINTPTLRQDSGRSPECCAPAILRHSGSPYRGAGVPESQVLPMAEEIAALYGDEPIESTGPGLDPHIPPLERNVTGEDWP